MQNAIKYHGFKKHPDLVGIRASTLVKGLDFGVDRAIRG